MDSHWLMLMDEAWLNCFHANIHKTFKNTPKYPFVPTIDIYWHNRISIESIIPLITVKCTEMVFFFTRQWFLKKKKLEYSWSYAETNMQMSIWITDLIRGESLIYLCCTCTNRRLFTYCLITLKSSL